MLEALSVGKGEPYRGNSGIGALWALLWGWWDDVLLGVLCCVMRNGGNDNATILLGDLVEWVKGATISWNNNATI